MENEFWKTILSEWATKGFPEIFPRGQEIATGGFGQLKKALVITGFRRTGKTYLMLSAVKKLLNTYSRKDIFYVNFEDERIPLETNTLTRLLPAFKSFFGRQPKFLFLDEVQNIPLWSKYVRRILDNEAVGIFLTGSSSKMSSFELPTELRGRSLEQKVWPLTFAEFLIFKNEKPDRERFNYLVNEYLTFGALPEIVRARPEDKINILQEYFKTVIRREIMERYRLKTEAPIKATTKLLLNSTYFSLSKIHRDLASQGIKLGKNTVGSYFNYLSSSYLFHPVSHFSFSWRGRETKPKKAYFIDNGFITAVSTKFSQNYGRLWENLICWQFLSQNKEIYYWQNQRKTDEVDYVICQNDKPIRLVQACYDLTDETTRKREFGALLRTGEKLGVEDLWMITGSGFRPRAPEKIRIVSAEDFLSPEKIT